MAKTQWKELEGHQSSTRVAVRGLSLGSSDRGARPPSLPLIPTLPTLSLTRQATAFLSTPHEPLSLIKSGCQRGRV